MSRIDRKLDVLDLRCPLPILKIKKELSSMQIGQLLEVKSNDPATRIDVPAFIKMSGHEVMSEPPPLSDNSSTNSSISNIEEEITFIIKKRK